MNCICCKNWGKCNCHRHNNMAEIYTSDASPHTLICGEEEPGFITPAQYKERTGLEYPERAAVYCHFNGEPNWYVDLEKTARKEGAEYIVCAFGDLVPPDDWRPDLFQ